MSMLLFSADFRKTTMYNTVDNLNNWDYNKLYIPFQSVKYNLYSGE